MFTIYKTPEFEEWLKSLKNHLAKKAIIKRIDRLELGHFGDIDNVGEGIFELRIHINVGIRIYAIQKGNAWILVLNGGDKSSQQKDIETAKTLAKLYQDWEHNDETD